MMALPTSVRTASSAPRTSVPRAWNSAVTACVPLSLRAYLSLESVNILPQRDERRIVAGGRPVQDGPDGTGPAPRVCGHRRTHRVRVGVAGERQHGRDPKPGSVAQHRGRPVAGAPGLVEAAVSLHR